MRERGKGRGGKLTNAVVIEERVKTGSVDEDTATIHNP
jgi:hypothetical protein